MYGNGQTLCEKVINTGNGLLNLVECWRRKIGYRDMLDLEPIASQQIRGHSFHR